MLLNSWPVRSLITRAARSYGFLDPIGLLAKMRGFAQPSEVAEPIVAVPLCTLCHTAWAQAGAGRRVRPPTPTPARR